MPLSVPLPGLCFKAMETSLVKDGVTFPKRSSAETVRPNDVPAVMLAGGWVVTTSCEVAAGVMSKALVVAEETPVVVAWIV